MSHGESTEWKDDSSTKIKTQLGVILFIVYTTFYAIFIFINVMFPKLMKADIGSINFAIVYGVGLIIFAVILALIYNQVCTRAEEKAEKERLLEEEGKAE